MRGINEAELRRWLQRELGASTGLVPAARIGGEIPFEKIGGEIPGDRLADASVEPAKLSLEAFFRAASSNTDLSGAGETDVPGCSYTTQGAGDWLIWANFQFRVTATELASARGKLSVGGVIHTSFVEQDMFDLAVEAGSGSWLLTDVPASTVIKLRGDKTAVGGAATLGAPHTTLMGVRIGG